MALHSFDFDGLVVDQLPLKLLTEHFRRSEPQCPDNVDGGLLKFKFQYVIISPFKLIKIGHSWEAIGLPNGWNKINLIF